MADSQRLHEFGTALAQTLEDHRLSKGERRALTEVLKDLGGDEDALRYVRNRAFDMAKTELPTRAGAMVLEWLEGVVRAVDGQRQREEVAVANAYFSPGDQCRSQIISLCGASSRTIDVCVFTITDDRIKRALIGAHDRGLKLRIITDDEKVDDRGSDIYDIRRHGVEVAIDRGPEFMHHKFAIFDGKTLIDGSFNWTRGASEHNLENIIVTDEARLVGQFTREFEELWGKLPRLE